MTREEKQKAIDALKISAPVMAMTQEEFNDYIQTLNKVMDWLEQEPCEDAISRQAAIDCLDWSYPNELPITRIKNLPSVTPQEPRCKECKWWKDSDGEYRRGWRAESHCPINTHDVYRGEGYCYMFSPKVDMREVEE